MNEQSRFIKPLFIVHHIMSFFVVAGTVKPFLVSLVELVDYLLGNIIQKWLWRFLLALVVFLVSSTLWWIFNASNDFLSRFFTIVYLIFLTPMAISLIIEVIKHK